jgi:hypothetical protein
MGKMKKNIILNLIVPLVFLTGFLALLLSTSVAEKEPVSPVLILNIASPLSNSIVTNPFVISGVMFYKIEKTIYNNKTAFAYALYQVEEIISNTNGISTNQKNIYSEFREEKSVASTNFDIGIDFQGFTNGTILSNVFFSFSDGSSRNYSSTNAYQLTIVFTND